MCNRQLRRYVFIEMRTKHGSRLCCGQPLNAVEYLKGGTTSRRSHWEGPRFCSGRKWSCRCTYRGPQTAGSVFVDVGWDFKEQPDRILAYRHCALSSSLSSLFNGTGSSCATSCVGKTVSCYWSSRRKWSHTRPGCPTTVEQSEAANPISRWCSGQAERANHSFR